MKNERPILFSAPMVRAILNGRKTQTRRIVRLNESGRVKQIGGLKNWHLDDANAVQACPYGKLGDHLWVRETWAEIPDDGGTWIYRADDPDDAWKQESGVRWKSGRFMPRAASRITLEIAGVRVERLKEITDEGAKAEGVEAMAWTNGNGTLTMRYTPHSVFATLWDEINVKKAPWESNPWVWVIEFKLLEVSR